MKLFNGEEKSVLLIIKDGAVDSREEKISNPDFEFTCSQDNFYKLLTGEKSGLLLMAFKKLKLTRGSMSELNRFMPILDNLVRRGKEISNPDKSREKDDSKEAGGIDIDFSWAHNIAFRIRIITALSLLILVLVLKLFLGYSLLWAPLIIIALIEAFLNQPYLFIRKRVSFKKLLYFNIFWDIVWITGFIYFFGGTDVPFLIAVYLIAITFSSMIVGVGTGVWIATLSSVLYAGMIALEHFQIIPRAAIIGTGISGMQKILLVVSSMLFFYLFALFPGYFLMRLKKKTAEIKKTKNMAQNILETMIDGVVITDMEGKVTSVNKAIVEQLGYAKEELIGRSPADLILAPRETEKFFSDLEKLLKGEKMLTSEYAAMRKNGHEFTTSISISVLNDEENKPMSIIVVTRDITETKQMIVNIKNSEDKLKAKVDELEKFNKLTVGRELKMIELKKRIKELEEKLSS